MRTFITLAIIAIAGLYILSWASNLTLAFTNHNGHGWIYGIGGTIMSIGLIPTMTEFGKALRMVHKV